MGEGPGQRGRAGTRHSLALVLFVAFFLRFSSLLFFSLLFSSSLTGQYPPLFNEGTLAVAFLLFVLFGKRRCRFLFLSSGERAGMDDGWVDG